MHKTYVFGHKKPDTDSVCSAISYAYLKNALGDNAEARVLGNINKETKFVLNKFGFEEPAYLNDVKVQIRSMNYNHDAFINESVSIDETFNTLHEMGVTGLPVVDKEQYLKGYINLKEIAKFIIDGDIYQLETSFDNIIKVLDGKEILKFDEEINGKIIAAAYKSSTFESRIKLSNNNILLVADRHSIMEYAINNQVKLMIIVGNNVLPDDLLELAKKNKVNVIVTPYTTYLTANKIKLCNYVKKINTNNNPIKFTLKDTREEFVEIANKFGHTNYPIVDKDDKCVGMLRLIDQNNYEKRNVILVDHNQAVQSVDGIEEANILEVIDHHNLGTIGTSIPISFRSMPVGCTCTVIYQIYKENHIEIPENVAGLMLSAILSDTLLLKSPTKTDTDKKVVMALAKKINVDIQEYGLEMFKAGTSLAGMDAKEILEQDFKTYKLDDDNLGISQVMTLDIDEIKKNENQYLELLNELSETYNYRCALMFVTDVINNGSYLFYNSKAEDIVKDAYDLNEIKQGIYLQDVVSRKKQMLPLLMDFLEKNN